MTRKLILAMILFTLTLAACSNPVDQLQEAASEQIAETIVEQATGMEDFEVDIDDEGSVSYSIDDGEGGQMDVQVNEAEDVDAITGMGFNIQLPDGLTDGTLQRIDDNGQEAMVTATFTAEGLTRAEVYRAMHTSLTAEGFTYLDTLSTGLSEPDYDNLPALVAYEHPDGFQFTVMGDESGLIMGLVRMETE